MSKCIKSNLKTYCIGMFLSIFIYMILLVGVNIVDYRFDLPQWQRIALSILPVFPAFATVVVILRFVRSLDEVWQKIATETTIISACVVGLGTFTLGFLGGVISLPEGLLIWVWPAMLMIHGLVLPIVRLRYS